MGTKLLVTQILLVIGIVNCNPCNEWESLNITLGVKFENGSIVHDEIVYPSSAWYEEEDNGTVTQYGCPCIGRICLWKCCAAGNMFVGRTCNTSDAAEINPFSPPLFKGREEVSEAADQHFFYMYNSLCTSRYLVDTLRANEFLFLQENGTLIEDVATRVQWHPPARFCVDYMETNATRRLVAAVCLPSTDNPTDDGDVIYIAYAVGLILSVPFLLATFLVYALISELRNLHGMCLMAYCAGLIVAYPLLAYLKLHIGQIGVETGGCWALAFIIYYAFQTSFFWLNVMCFDIWRTFRGYRGGSTSKKRERRRFMLYGAYAWGIPVILTAITAGMQFSENLPTYIITPNFGDRRCWFEDWLSELAYFFTPVLVLVVCNLVLFSITAYRIRSIKQETAILKSSESSRSDKLKKDKQRYALYLKLFMVMGVNWTVEIIGFAAGGSNWYWVLIDVSNIGLGFFIFLIFVWKNKVRNLVRKKFNKCRGRANEFPVGTHPDSSSGNTGRWATRSSSAPTEVTRVSADEAAVRLSTINRG